MTINDTTAVITYTDPAMNGTLSPNGTINYASGAFFLGIANAGHIINASFNYFPDLPVMGLRDLVLNLNQFPTSLGFDTVYSYNIASKAPYSIYDVSFYKNPILDAVNLPGYVRKTVWTPTTWNGQDYQQFWTINYEGALWETNGIDVPFTGATIGMQFAPAGTITFVSATATTIVVTITNCPLVIGDFVFINEWGGTNASTLNLQSGYVTAAAPNTPGFSTKTLTITFPFATIGTGPYTPGIIQYLTNRSDPTKDSLRWYDGDPTNAIPPNPSSANGWVNFAPPLSKGTFSIANTRIAQYYLVGARLIFPFKDRLLFFGAVIQASTGSPIYLQDTIVYSQNGTPYYTASFTGDPSLPTTVFHPILVPNQITTSNSTFTATAPAYFEDQTGFGGFVSAGIDQPILTVSPNEDALIVGFDRLQTRVIYSGNDIVPFNFFIINSELGSSSTFSTINMDKGIITRGNRGYIITSQVEAKRIDLEIPDQVFEISLANNGTERITAQRDFINEWIYMTYPVNQDIYKFPNQTLQYNYRDDSWAIFNESYTTYGQFRPSSGYSWATIGQKYASWNVWNDPWNAGQTTLFQPQVIGGNQQGFIVFRADGTNEGTSLYIQNISFPATITNITQANPAVITANNTFVVGQTIIISGVVGMTQINGLSLIVTAVTPTTITVAIDSTIFGAYVSGGIATPYTIYSPNHTLNEGDYIVISGVLGTIASQVNGKIFSIGNNPTANDFNLNPTITTGTYLGGGLIQRMYVPQVKTKQFPGAWEMGRKTRIGTQQYLFTRTFNAQVTLLIFLSQDDETAYNNIEFPLPVQVVPSVSCLNNSLIYNTIVYTCPESTNLGLTPANTNLQMLTSISSTGVSSNSQQQIWHRMNTSLIGDAVQVGFTLSDTQMRTLDANSNFISQFAEIELHGFILDVNPSQLLS